MEREEKYGLADPEGQAQYQKLRPPSPNPGPQSLRVLLRVTEWGVTEQTVEHGPLR